MSTTNTTLKKALLWFRNDLRLHDNESLIKTLRLANSSTNNTSKVGVLPLYCFDPRHFGFSRIGKFRKANANRTRFLTESVDNLRKNLLNEWGLKLMIQIGHPEEIIPQLCSQYEIEQVFADKEVTSEETSIEQVLEKQVNVNYSYGFSMVHVEDLPFKIENLPHVFTDFRRKVENPKLIVRPLLKLSPNEKKLISSRVVNLIQDENALGKTPDLKVLGYTDEEISEMMENLKDPRSVLHFKGGEDEALARLNDYLWTQDRLKTYKETRNGLVGEAYSSKLSPWLSLGCISPRKIYHEVKRYEKERVENDSTYWLIFELLWRDYFRFFAEKFGNHIFMLKGVTRASSKRKGLIGDSSSNKVESKYDETRWKQDLKLFKLWADGKTGLPFVDANMRELKISGWMSNRGRQNVASFLSKDLNLDWRLGAEYFESLLLDHSVTSNWGNWLYAAGVGDVDPRGEARYFNVVKQGFDYDFNGEFVKFWIPELDQVPQRCIHAPYLMSESEQTNAKCTIGVDYPKPLVNVKAHHHLNDNGVKANYKHKTGKANERERKIR